MNGSLCFYWTKLVFPWPNSYVRALQPRVSTILNSVSHYQPQQNIPKSCTEKLSKLQNFIFFRETKWNQSTQKERKGREGKRAKDKSRVPKRNQVWQKFSLRKERKKVYKEGC